jgi:hypothetical protein
MCGNLRQDMYRIFFQNMKQPFVEIVLYVLHLPHSKDKVRSEGASLSKEDICTGVSLMVEIISTFTIVSPQFFRKMVLEGPVPPINPMSTTLTKHSSDEGKWKPRCLLFLLIDAIVTNRCDTGFLFYFLCLHSQITSLIHPTLSCSVAHYSP